MEPWWIFGNQKRVIYLATETENSRADKKAAIKWFPDAIISIIHSPKLLVFYSEYSIKYSRFQGLVSILRPSFPGMRIAMLNIKRS